jgi:putative MFS transporter
MSDSVAERPDRLPIVPFHRRLLLLIGADMFFDRFDIDLAASAPGELMHNGMSSVPPNAWFISPTSSACYWAMPVVT